MEAIIKTLLLEGIDEATIHRVLDVIEEDLAKYPQEGENYSERHRQAAMNSVHKRHKEYVDAEKNYDNALDNLNPKSAKSLHNAKVAGKKLDRAEDRFEHARQVSCDEKSSENK